MHETPSEPPEIAGEMCEPQEPYWEGLRRLVPYEVADSFMLMYDVLLADGTRLHAYKHYWTRRYAHLSDDGRAYQWTKRERYQQVPAATAILATLDRDDRDELPVGVLHEVRGRVSSDEDE